MRGEPHVVMRNDAKQPAPPHKHNNLNFECNQERTGADPHPEHRYITFEIRAVKSVCAQQIL